MTVMRVDYIIAFHSVSIIYINLKTFVNVSDQVVNISGGESVIYVHVDLPNVTL